MPRRSLLTDCGLCDFLGLSFHVFAGHAIKKARLFFFLLGKCYTMIHATFAEGQF